MVRWLGILLRTFHSAVRTRRELALENLALRQQLAVWKARQPRPRLTEMDRIFWIVLARLWKNWRSSLQVVRCPSSKPHPTRSGAPKSANPSTGPRPRAGLEVGDRH